MNWRAPSPRHCDTASFEEISQRWRAVGNTLFHLTGLSYEPRTSHFCDERVTARQTGRYKQIQANTIYNLKGELYFENNGRL